MADCSRVLFDNFDEELIVPEELFFVCFCDLPKAELGFLDALRFDEIAW